MARFRSKDDRLLGNAGTWASLRQASAPVPSTALTRFFPIPWIESETMMTKRSWTRRAFVKQVAGLSCAAGGLSVFGFGHAAEVALRPSEVGPHTLTTIRGTPRERGRQYGRAFRTEICDFLDREIYAPFAQISGNTKAKMLDYARRCSEAVSDYSPILSDEVAGAAEGAGLKVEELVLITLHEELYHRGVLPSVDHCTVAAAGPPETADGHAYVGQTWDWMQSVYGLSTMLLWDRPEGPSLLSYAYPGLWAGAGVNEAGIALCWTTATDEQGIPGPRVGIPSYLLIAQILYQESLDAAVEEARRARHAGWFTFVLADGEGRLANIEGSPRELAVEFDRGHMARHNYGSRQMTGVPEGAPPRLNAQCQHMKDLLAGARGRLDCSTLQSFLGDHQFPICKSDGTIDGLLFDTTSRVAYVTRGPSCSGRWKRFSFEDRAAGTKPAST
jgi:isopenicillin-N N-acyltransferase-like protein